MSWNETFGELRSITQAQPDQISWERLMGLLLTAYEDDALRDRIDEIALPYVEAGPHRAFAGLIIGPAAHWGRAREAARNARVGRAVQAMRNAWRRTFGRGIRVTGVAGMAERYQAIFVNPADDALNVAAVDARDLRAIAELGWTWLTGDWVAARAVTYRRSHGLRLRARRPVLALFDGEPQTLAPDTEISGGTTAPIFLATKP